jgi:LuxR family maltose regulon positive regulatory protein
LIEPLSTRELEVLRLVAAGKSNGQIARELVLALGTVKRHVSNICGKLEARSRTECVARARELGLLR